ncbi:MAG: hypothetical protein J7493_13295 [Porphyrobacter sp.]|nr:hypothetical protein [Porphyrobacter sp.]
MQEKPRTTLPAFTPVPREKKRHDGWTPEVQRSFIEALAETGSVKSAARRVGRAPVGAYYLRRHPAAEEFRHAWQAALDIGIQRIEDIAMERAINGVEEPVYSYGKLVGTRTKYNDQLLMFMLRSRAPGRFTGGKATALNGSDKFTLERLKKQLRKEWEEEQAAAARAEDTRSAAEVRASIDRKIAATKAQVLSRRSPAAFEHELALQAQLRADEAAGWRPGLPYPEYAAKAAALLPEFTEQVRREWPGYEEQRAEWDRALRAAIEAGDWDEVVGEDGDKLALPGPE